jgi:hypothetical protein
MEISQKIREEAAKRGVTVEAAVEEGLAQKGEEYRRSGRTV